MEALRMQAKEEAKVFLEEAAEYRMGFVEAEQPHPLTKDLSRVYASDTAEGVRLLFRVDREMATRAIHALRSAEYAAFAAAIRDTLAAGGRVIFSGCGSSGRLSMCLEQSWRKAIEDLCEAYPRHEKALKAKTESVCNLMTGGDYAVIRAVEFFEDSAALGKKQARELQLCEKDLLVGVTATGETTSILGTAMQALEDGAQVYMLICSDPVPLTERMERARKVYLHAHCRYLVLPCGPMALTGSTRMQSSSFEQLAAAIALEGALCDLLTSLGEQVSFLGYGYYADAFLALTERLTEDACVRTIAALTDREREVYEKGGCVTLFADASMMDVLTDTTERAPTFMTPPFRSLDMKEGEESWAFAKNPTCDSRRAWYRLFHREARCIEWDRSVYPELGVSRTSLSKLFDISRKALLRFPIGNEPMPQRENTPLSFALWVDCNEPDECFARCATSYVQSAVLTPARVGITPLPTKMSIYEHLAMKLMLNVLSTGVMAKMGKIMGNWMTCLSISNKKLVDRCIRIVADQCGLPYEAAAEEVFYSKLLLEREGQNRSCAESTIERLGIKK